MMMEQILPPHQRHSDTSVEAAEQVSERFSGMMDTVFKKIGLQGSFGLTDEEGQISLRMEGNSYRPCRVTLVDRGMVHDSGKRRKTIRNRNAVVWELTEFGKEVFKKWVENEPAQ